MSEPFIGQIMMVGFNFPPRGWAQCNGQLLPISSHTALFSLLGTTFGGDGRTSFGLPDLRGRIAKHIGQGPGLANVTWGQRGGRENVTLTIANMPSHTHTVTNDLTVTPKCNAAAADGDDPSGGFPGPAAEDIYSSTGTVDMGAAAVGGLLRL